MRNLLVLLSLSACATAPPPNPKGGPRGLRANEHLVVADQHTEIARHDGANPDMRSNPAGSVNLPWARSWDTGEDHRRLAAIHRSEAAALHAAFSEACGGDSSAAMPVSPLQRYGIGGTPTPAGYTFYLSPAAGPPERLLAEMRCHRAWMMLAPSNMEDCPLDLPELVVDAHGDAEGIVVTVEIRDAKLVPELQRRALLDLGKSEMHR